MTTVPPHFAAYAEMHDAAAHALDLSAAPGAAVIELAKLLTRFEGEIDDEWRVAIIAAGGGLIRLANQG